MKACFKKLYKRQFYRALVTIGFLLCMPISHAQPFVFCPSSVSPNPLVNGDIVTMTFCLGSTIGSEYTFTNTSFFLYLPGPSTALKPFLKNVQVTSSTTFENFYYDDTNGIIWVENLGPITYPTPATVTVTGTVACDASGPYPITGTLYTQYIAPPLIEVVVDLCASCTVPPSTCPTPASLCPLTLTTTGPLIITDVTITPAPCASATGSATVTFTGGSPYYTATAVSAINSSPPITLPGPPITIPNLTPGQTYTFSVTDGADCLVTWPFPMTITTSPDIAILEINTTGSICESSNDTGTITVYFSGFSGMPPHSYSVTVTGVTPSTVTQTTSEIANPEPGVFQATLIGLPAGNYNVTVTDATIGCSVTSITSVTVASIDPLVIAQPSFTPPSCTGASDATLTVSVFGGSGQYLVNATGPTGTLTQLGSNQAPIVFTGLSAGTYTISVFDNLHPVCSTTLPFAVIIPPAPSPVVIGAPLVKAPLCFGGLGSIIVTVSGGTGKYALTATPVNPALAPVTAAGTDTAPIIIPNLIAGTSYSLIATDSNGCVSPATASISVPQPSQVVVSVAAFTNETCPGFNNGSLMVTATGGTPPYQFSIEGGATGTFVSNNTFSPLVPGAYTIVAMDNVGCTSSPVTQVIAPAAPIIINTIATSPSCPGGSDGQIIINASGGTGMLMYALVTPPPLMFTTSNIIKNLKSGTYQVAVQDANMCQAFSPLITIPAAAVFYIKSVTVTPITAAGAKNATITVNLEGGVATSLTPIVYSLDGGTPQSSNIFTGVGPGVHTITVTDATPCTLSYTTQNILDPSVLTILTAPTVSPCVGQANGMIFIIASGGVPPYTYSIDGGVTYSTAFEFTGLPVGTYKLAVKDSRGAVATGSVTIASSTPITIKNVSVTGISCIGASNGSLTVTATGGTGTLTYSIDGGITFTVSNTFTGLAAGQYTVIVKDQNGCTAQTVVSLTQPSQLTVSVQATTTNVCTGAATVTITASGGTPPYMYSINGGATFKTTNVFTNVLPGKLSIVVKDANGCTATTSALIQCG